MFTPASDARAAFDTALGALLWDAWNAGNDHMFETVAGTDERKAWDKEDRRLNREMMVHVILPAYAAGELTADDVYKLSGLYR